MGPLDTLHWHPPFWGNFLRQLNEVTWHPVQPMCYTTCGDFLFQDHQLSRPVWVLPGRKTRRQVFSWSGSFQRHFSLSQGIKCWSFSHGSRCHRGCLFAGMLYWQPQKLRSWGKMQTKGIQPVNLSKCPLPLMISERFVFLRRGRSFLSFTDCGHQSRLILNLEK